MKKLKLSRGKVALIDDEDFEYLNQWKWSCSSKDYAFRNIYLPRRGSIGLHREIMDDPKGKDVDHINGNKLDNRRSNLRICTRAENSKNRITVKSKSGHLGVYWSNQNKKWNAQIGLSGKSTSLGFFDDIQDAIKARQQAAKQYFGEFAPQGNK